MEIQHLLPSGIASILVKRYECITNDREEYIVDKHVPNGYASFVFNFNRGVNIAGFSTLPPFILVPPFLKAIHVESHQSLDTFVIICKASVLSRLFDFDLYPRPNDSYIDLESKFYYSLWDQLKPCKKPAERIDFFEKALQEKTGIKLYKPDEIDHVYENIITDAGKNHIGKIMESCTINPRTFRRKFIQRVGINAKSLSRLVRVNYLWDKIINHQAVNFQEMVFDGEYFDQSHFIKDFKMITGESPNHFFKRNLELVKILSGKN